MMHFSVSVVVSRCTKLGYLMLSLPYHSAIFSRLVSFLEAADTTCFAMTLQFCEFPQCPTPSTELWKSLDSVLQAPQWQSVKTISIHQVPMNSPHKKIVWGNTYERLPFDADEVRNRLRVNLAQTSKSGVLYYHYGNRGFFNPV